MCIPLVMHTYDDQSRRVSLVSDIIINHQSLVVSDVHDFWGWCGRVPSCKSRHPAPNCQHQLDILVRIVNAKHQTHAKVTKTANKTATKSQPRVPRRPSSAITANRQLMRCHILPSFSTIEPLLYETTTHEEAYST
jgi:hypothetical protein